MVHIDVIRNTIFLKEKHHFENTQSLFVLIGVIVNWTLITMHDWTEKNEIEQWLSD